MTSKFQKVLFPIEELGRFQSITVKAPTGDTVNIDYKNLDLVVYNNQLCWYYESEDGNLVMPIARISTIDKLMEKS